MIQIRWNAKQAQAKMAALHAALTGVSLAAMIRGEFGPYVSSVTEGRFINEGDEATGQWLPLAPATRRFREQQGFSPAHPINVRTGQMMAHVTPSNFKSTMVSEYSVKMRYPEGEPTGELLNKMVMAQQGGVGPSGSPIPARPVLSFKASDAATLLSMTAAHLQAVMRAA